MIKLLGKHEESGRTFLCIVLTRENIDRLEKDAIHFHAEQMNVSQLVINEIIIMFFETIELALDFFKDKAAITEATVVINEDIEKGTVN